ncbi:MAG: UDP-glucose 4-epimerase GalE [Methylophaga sp.]|nr:UDP-glucose 4-epimerase GalE [Methylophaga sp.]
MKVLVFGGAGYIGSHVCKYLAKHGHEITVFDNLSTGHAEAVCWGNLVQQDILNPEAIVDCFRQHGPFDLVMHFCAKSLVGESVTSPEIYYRNNVVGTLNILDAMLATAHQRIIFSSTAAVYGNPQQSLIDERHPRLPINPYGQSKKMVEVMLLDYANAHGLDSVSLRYFNACGADPEADIGESHQPETHLIPNVLKSLVNPTNNVLKIFGDQYPTADGTCIRDYIHVNDLAQAHLLAGEFLFNHSGAFAFNLGNGSGFSVMDVVKAASQVTGREIDYQIEAPRAGDPPILVANAHQAQQQLGWKAQYTSLEAIIETAWRWHQNENF